MKCPKCGCVTCGSSWTQIHSDDGRIAMLHESELCLRHQLFAAKDDLAAALEAEREMREVLEAVHDVLDNEMGDSDPDIGDCTDDEIRDQEPLFWASMKISDTLNRHLVGE
jgi:hypothetical protein